MPHIPQIPPLAGMTPLGVKASNVVPFPRMLQPVQRDEVEMARRRLAAPLKPKSPQQPCDVGLFSDDRQQLDLLDLTRRGS